MQENEKKNTLVDLDEAPARHKHCVKLSVCGPVDVARQTIYATTICNVNKSCNSTSVFILYCHLMFACGFASSDLYLCECTSVFMAILISAVCSLDSLVVDLYITDNIPFTKGKKGEKQRPCWTVKTQIGSDSCGSSCSETQTQSKEQFCSLQI